MSRPPFRFGLASLFGLMAGIGFLTWAMRSSIFWLLAGVFLFKVVVSFPFLMFFAFVYWLNREHING